MIGDESSYEREPANAIGEERALGAVFVFFSKREYSEERERERKLLRLLHSLSKTQSKHLDPPEHLPIPGPDFRPSMVPWGASRILREWINHWSSEEQAGRDETDEALFSFDR